MMKLFSHQAYHRKMRGWNFLNFELIPFNPTPSKFTVIENFNREHLGGLCLMDAEIDKLLDPNAWQYL